MTQRTDLNVTVFNEDKCLQLIRPMSMNRPDVPKDWVFNAPIEHKDRLVTTNLYAKAPQLLKCLCYSCIKQALPPGQKIYMGMPVPRSQSEKLDKSDPFLTVDGLLDAGYIGVYTKPTETMQERIDGKDK